MKGLRHEMGTLQRDSRDEDLALFHDMRRRERRNFLYLLADEVDASPTATPSRTGRELLPLDSEKNEFDWLLTPPSTPLFPSLDRDGPIVNLSQRRVLTRSASVSRTARLSYPQEPSPKGLHGRNPSPKRPSTASSTNSSVSTCRGRPLSPSFTSRSSPSVRSSSPCRPITPTGRNSVAASRSSSRSLTPTLHRNSTSPSAANRPGPGVLNGRSRGKSLSPKLGPWEPSLPGFSAEPPPNLRTSLSDRTLQRGVSHTSKNKAKTRGSSAEMFDPNSQSLRHVDSPDGCGSWSLSYSIDHNSSQNSRASAVSNDDDVDMAESVLSGSTHSDRAVKCANVIPAKSEDSSSRRSVLPAKRQLKSAGSTTDAMPFLSLAARKSYERQSAQRRNAQAMFRPLLSSAPVTSFYTSRPGGMHLRSSIPFMESFAAQSSSIPVSRNEGSHMETASVALTANSKSEQPACEVSLCGIQMTIEEESEGNSITEEEALGCETSCGLRDSEGRPSDLKEQADGHKLNILSSAEQNNERLAESKEDSHTSSEDTCRTCPLPAQCLKQGPLNDKAQHGDTNCAMDFETTDHDHASLSTSTRLSKESNLMSEESKVKENPVEDQKLATSSKTHSSYLGIGNILSQHGSQRVLSDLGSFRKHSPMKGLYTRSQDGALFGEKNGSCDSFMSDSHSLMKSLSSALGSGQSVDRESSGGATIGNGHSESTTLADKSHSVERVSSSLDRDILKKGMPFFVTPAGTVGDVLVIDGNSQASATVSLSANSDSFDHEGLHSVLTDLMEVGTETTTSEVYTRNSLACASTSDIAAHQDVLSIIGSCASRITMLDEHGCFEAAGTDRQSRTFPDACTAPTLPGETSNADDDWTLRQPPGARSLKRNVTLEEATDTILFCNSVVHELVYKAATLAIENEEEKVSKPLVSKRDFVALFGFSAADNRPYRAKTAKPARNPKRQPLANTAVCETSSFVQKQRMVHRQTPAVTMRQNPIERIGNAVMGNHEEMHMPIVSMLPRRKSKQGKAKKAKCRCSCCMM